MHNSGDGKVFGSKASGPSFKKGLLAKMFMGMRVMIKLEKLVVGRPKMHVLTKPQGEHRGRVFMRNGQARLRLDSDS